MTSFTDGSGQLGLSERSVRRCAASLHLVPCPEPPNPAPPCSALRGAALPCPSDAPASQSAALAGAGPLRSARSAAGRQPKSCSSAPTSSGQRRSRPCRGACEHEQLCWAVAVVARDRFKAGLVACKQAHPDCPAQGESMKPLPLPMLPKWQAFSSPTAQPVPDLGESMKPTRPRSAGCSRSRQSRTPPLHTTAACTAW